MSYTQDDYEKFSKLRTLCSLIGFNNYRRNIGRLEMTKFLKKFSKKDQEAMFKKDNKEHKL